MDPPFDQYGSNVPPPTNYTYHPPSPATSDDVKDAPVALVHNNRNGKIRNRLRCVPNDACESFTVAVFVVMAILVTSIVMLLAGVGNQTVAYTWTGSILGMALIKMTKASAQKRSSKKNKVVSV